MLIQNSQPTAGDPEARSINPIVRLRGIEKRFDNVVALQGVDAAFYPGELHCILGENGAGKSTLMQVIAGTLHPDAGEIEIHGVTRKLRTRQDGIKLGIGMVQQHYGLIEQLTAVENFLLGWPEAGNIVNAKQAARRLREIGEDIGLDVRVDRKAAEMPTGERQRLEILIALASGSDCLILDEPTSALSTQDVDVLIAVLRKLQSRGKAIAYITHKLREVTELANRATVLRRGQVVRSFEKNEITREDLTEAMIGKLAAVEISRGRVPGRAIARLRTVDTGAAPGGCPLNGVDLSLHANEIVGVAGMVGNGQDELAQLLAGLIDPLAGEVSPRANIVAYIPENRSREGVAESLSVSDNAIVHRHNDPALKRGIRLDPKRVGEFAQSLLNTGDVRAGSLDMRVGLLSGGNQQKLVVARELDRGPELIVAHNPYRGLDGIATRAVRENLIAARDRGCPVLVLSPDLDDLMDLADRIVVLSKGKIAGEVDPRTATAEEIGLLMGKGTETQ